MNPRVVSLNPSSTLKLTALTKKLIKEGKDVVNFAAGEPDFDTPDFIKNEAKKALDAGFTKYTPSSGELTLRELIAKKLNTENSIACQAKDIIVTSGAKYAIYAAILTAIKNGDEVLLPSPYWVSYSEMVNLIGGKCRFIETCAENNFRIEAGALKKAITKKTKLLILNYPNNPTGATYQKEELEEINKAVAGANIYVLSDEIYEKLIYDNRQHTSFASLKGAAEYTITVNGFSKAFSMTGWRLGYLTANPSFVEQVSKVIDHTTSCPSSISQRAAIGAFTDKDWVSGMVKEFERRRDALYRGLTNIKGVTPFKSQGTFYMFCDISRSGLSSADFCSKLLNDLLVSAIPGDAFGAEGFIRLSFATSISDIQKGVDRINKFFKSISPRV